MNFYDFEKSIIDKIDTWQPTAVARQDFRIVQYGFGDQPTSGLRLAIGFDYGTDGNGDRASIGETYLERIRCNVSFDLYHGGAIARKDFLELYAEMKDWLKKNMATLATPIDQWDVESGYLENRESVLSLIGTFRLEREVTL